MRFGAKLGKIKMCSIYWRKKPPPTGGETISKEKGYIGKKAGIAAYLCELPELDEPSAYAEPSVGIETFRVCHYIHSQNVRVGIFTQKPFNLVQPMRALLLATGQFLIGKWKPNKILLRSFFLISVQPRPGGIWPKKTSL